MSSTMDAIAPDVRPRPAHWLSLAAAPTFAVMALVTGLHDGNMPAMLCASDASPFTGMVAMYLLMCAFHLPPWLRLVTRWREDS
ncbi:hypothetical protein [Bradyrhizobium jicamae]|uniref:hypothetical protein n=1 Tax=Bradyrhizobium jicamae TaxID=280332 RepID=UPI0020111E71|nr:hypothetical protein [Bradyrhizobium jicamae]